MADERTILFPTFEIPDELELESDVPEYLPSVRFDFDLGDFVTVGGKVETTDGYQAWLEWCIKACKTERFIHLAYSDDYGTELGQTARAVSRSEAEALVETTITEALEIDPRTGRVHSFEFEWDGDKLGVSFIAEPTIGTAAQVQVTYEGLF